MATFRFPTWSYSLFTLKTGQFEAKNTIQKATFDFCFCEANLDQRCQFFLDRGKISEIFYRQILCIWFCTFRKSQCYLSLSFISGHVYLYLFLAWGERGHSVNALIEIFQLGPVERAVLTQVLGDSRPHKRKIQLRCETCSVSFNSQVRKIIIMVRVTHVVLNFYNGQENWS